MIPDSEAICHPDTGEVLKRVGTVRRIVREPDHTYFLLIPVCYSESEDKYHRVLPDFLRPYKHYNLSTICRAVNDDQDLDLYDLPSGSSRTRWKKLAYALLERKSELKHTDSPASLSKLLHHNSICATSDSVITEMHNHWFSPEELAGLLNHPIHKRL